MHLRLCLDLGQAQDYSAAAILACPLRWAEVSPQHPVKLIHCERIPLHTPYPEIVDYVKDELFPRVRRYAADERAKRHPKLRGPDPWVTLVVDHSGVGRPVVDLFRRAKLHPVAITITSGIDASGDDFHGWRVPLYDLVDGLALAVRPPATRAIAADLPGLPQLLEEFQTFERKLTKAGTSQPFGNFREHSHDDLLFALAIGLWDAQHGYQSLAIKVLGL
jgi:hypothetical protein